MTDVIHYPQSATGPGSIAIEPARLQDLPGIVAIQNLSLRTLGASHYEPRQIESFLRYVPTIEEQIVADGTYFVARRQGRIVGCGGWSTREPAYRTLALANEGEDASAVVRAIYVHPQAARCGIGRMLLQFIEDAVVARGYAEVELDATLLAVSLYESCGYRRICATALFFPNGANLPLVRMRKSLAVCREAVG